MYSDEGYRQAYPEWRAGYPAKRARLAKEGRLQPSETEQKLIDRIVQGEVGMDDRAKQFASPYDIPGGYVPTARPLTSMSLDEVQALQEARKSTSTVMGGLQLEKAKVAHERQRLGLPGNVLFDRDTQTKMGMDTLYDARDYRAFQEGRITPDEFMYGLSKEFASVANPKTGLSYHKVRGTNKPQAVKTTKAELMPILEELQREFGPIN